MSTFGEADQVRLGRSLLALRMRAGISGRELGRRTHMSQSKISKIETGRYPTSTVDVERIVHALNVPEVEAAPLLNLAMMPFHGFRSLREDAATGIISAQRELASLESGSKEIRFFMPAGIPGLLQTRAYAKSLLLQANPGRSGVDAMIDAKQDRQRILQHRDKLFTWIFTPSALHWPGVDVQTLADQHTKIAETASLPNVNILVLDLSQIIPTVPLHGFVIYDNRLVTVEMFVGEMAFRDPRDITEHQQIFDYYTKRADDIRHRWHMSGGPSAKRFQLGLDP